MSYPYSTNYDPSRPSLMQALARRIQCTRVCQHCHILLSPRIENPILALSAIDSNSLNSISAAWVHPSPSGSYISCPCPSNLRKSPPARKQKKSIPQKKGIAWGRPFETSSFCCLPNSAESDDFRSCFYLFRIDSSFSCSVSKMSWLWGII
jgi:hypothetical protein